MKFMHLSALESAPVIGGDNASGLTPSEGE